MVNHRAAAALVLITSLVKAVAFPGANARPAVHPDAHGPGYVANAVAAVMIDARATCNNCGLPEPKLEPPLCHTCEPPKPELTCNKVHGVQVGETCYSVGQYARLTLDQFLGFNPNTHAQFECLHA